MWVSRRLLQKLVDDRLHWSRALGFDVAVAVLTFMLLYVFVGILIGLTNVPAHLCHTNAGIDLQVLEKSFSGKIWFLLLAVTTLLPTVVHLALQIAHLGFYSGSNRHEIREKLIAEYGAGKESATWQKNSKKTWCIGAQEELGQFRLWAISLAAVLVAFIGVGLIEGHTFVFHGTVIVANNVSNMVGSTLAEPLAGALHWVNPDCIVQSWIDL